MNKLKFIVAASIAVALTLSCAPADENEEGDENEGGSSSSKGNSSGGTTETYTLTDSGIDSDGDAYFKYSIPDLWGLCEEGVYSTETFDQIQYYSIDNKKMFWGLEPEYSIQFNGTSNELIGTWTRTKSACELEEYDYGEYMFCKSNYDVTKAVITDTTIAITRQVCPTDYVVNGSDAAEGWKRKVKDCNTVEISKGSEKITEIYSNDGGEKTTYKGKSCELALTKAKKTAACIKAWNEEGDGDYMWILYQDYRVCREGILPEEFFGDDRDFCDIYPELCGGEVCTDEDGIFDFCDCNNDCLCADFGDEFYTNWCENLGAKPSISAKAAAKIAKPAIFAIKAKPVAKAPKAKAAKANKYSNFFNKKK